MMLEKIRKAGLKLNLTKYAFFRSNIEFLGHTISGDDIRSDEIKVNEINDLPAPRNLQQKCGFTGLVSTCHRLIKNFMRIARPGEDLRGKFRIFM
jgi:hypothetical protein